MIFSKSLALDSNFMIQSFIVKDDEDFYNIKEVKNFNLIERSFLNSTYNDDKKNTQDCPRHPTSNNKKLIDKLNSLCCSWY